MANRFTTRRIRFNEKWKGIVDETRVVAYDIILDEYLYMGTGSSHEVIPKDKITDLDKDRYEYLRKLE